ncbi:MAG: anthranilate phosphoribosyltransferase [Deltaproteobacteria bacterium]|nr:anthranilate phosphoribosyltransferase [Deltaproteobacteria bacterium]
MSGDDLARDEAEDVMEDIMSGVATPAQIAAWLVAMRNKGETPEEIAACVAIMRRFAKPLRAPEGVILDTCGTGGDGAGTFNISTVAALVVAGAGVRVAKHGNRSITSKCGSADVLTELAVNITCPAERMERALANANIGFAFAPLYHGAMRHAIGPRREIGVRTLFNMLGPMTNPAGARHQLIGVFEKRLTRFFADVLHLLGSERALVVHGSDGLDEITLTGPTYAAELRGGSIREFDIDPREFGLTLCDASDLAGGSPWENKCIALEILDGAKGPKRDIVLLNAGAALYVAGNAEDIAAGIRLAADSIDGGRARAALNRLIEETRDDEPA